MDFLILVDERQHSVSSPKKKVKREVKNLEYSINFDARVVDSSRVRGKRGWGFNVAFLLSFGFFPMFFICLCFSLVLVSFLYTPCMLKEAFTLF
jgi:hypothetical protein